MTNPFETTGIPGPGEQVPNDVAKAERDAERAAGSPEEHQWVLGEDELAPNEEDPGRG